MQKGIITHEGLEDLLNNIPAVLYEYAIFKDKDNQFLYLSPPSEKILGHSPEYFLEDMNRFWEMVYPEDLERMQNRDVNANLSKGYFISEVRILHPSGEERWIQLSSKPKGKINNKGQLWNGYIIDITDRKSSENEIETLKGMLPMCSACKKIRDDKGYWEQVESYITKNSNVQITHGLCEDCIEDLYGSDMLDKINNTRR